MKVLLKKFTLVFLGTLLLAFAGSGCVYYHHQDYNYRGSGRYASPPIINIDIATVQRPLRYIVIRQYDDWYSRNYYYNRSGRNYFRSWFGDNRHHRHSHNRWCR